jgi:hypothetical protein
VIGHYASATIVTGALLYSFLSGTTIWAAYLTHWIMTFQWVSCTAAAVWPRHDGLLWTRPTVFTVSLMVTVLYWAVVHRWNAPMSPLAIVEHGLGTGVATYDLLASNTRSRVVHVAGPYALCVVWLIWSAVYYALGGEDEMGHHYLYSVVSWNKRVPTTIFVLLTGTVAVPLAFTIMCTLEWVFAEARAGGGGGGEGAFPAVQGGEGTGSCDGGDDGYGSYGLAAGYIPLSNYNTHGRMNM